MQSAYVVLLLGLLCLAGVNAHLASSYNKASLNGQVALFTYNGGDSDLHLVWNRQTSQFETVAVPHPSVLHLADPKYFPSHLEFLSIQDSGSPWNFKFVTSTGVFLQHRTDLASTVGADLRASLIDTIAETVESNVYSNQWTIIDWVSPEWEGSQATTERVVVSKVELGFADKDGKVYDLVPDARSLVDNSVAGATTWFIMDHLQDRVIFNALADNSKSAVDTCRVCLKNPDHSFCKSVKAVVTHPGFYDFCEATLPNIPSYPTEDESASFAVHSAEAVVQAMIKCCVDMAWLCNRVVFGSAEQGAAYIEPARKCLATSLGGDNFFDASFYTPLFCGNPSVVKPYSTVVDPYQCQSGYDEGEIFPKIQGTWVVGPEYDYNLF